MTTTDLQPATGSYLTPTFEHATVADAMRLGVLVCGRDMTLRGVARMMTTRHVHTIVVDGPPWAMLTARDIVAHGQRGAELRAADVAHDEPPAVTTDRPLAAAAAMMAERGTSHVLALDPATGRPVGMVSSLDIAGIIAWGEG